MRNTVLYKIKDLHNYTSIGDNIEKYGEYNEFMSPWITVSDEQKVYYERLGESIYDMSYTKYDLLYKYVVGLYYMSRLKLMCLNENNVSYVCTNGIYEYDLVSEGERQSIIDFYQEVCGTSKVAMNLPAHREQTVSNYNFINANVNYTSTTRLDLCKVIGSTFFNCLIGPIGYFGGCTIVNSTLNLVNGCELNGVVAKNSIITGSGSIVLIDAIGGQEYTNFSGCTVGTGMTFYSLDGQEITIGA